jgi:hypothetical protein
MKTLHVVNLQDTTTEFTLKPSANQDNVVRVFKKGTKKRLKRNFALSDGQNLYVRIKQISKKFSSKDRGQMKDDGNYCIKVEQLGPNYLYFRRLLCFWSFCFFRRSYRWFSIKTAKRSGLRLKITKIRFV